MTDNQLLTKLEIIKKAYKQRYDLMLRNGRLLIKDTDKGIWGYSDPDAIFELFKEIKLDKHKRFLDLGSGDGSIVLIASLFGIEAVGIEDDDELYRIGNDIIDESYELYEIRNDIKELPNLKTKPECKFIKGDYMEHDFKGYDLIFINPDKEFHLGLEEKLQKEMNGKLYVYNNIFRPVTLTQNWVKRFNGVIIAEYTKDE